VPKTVGVLGWVCRLECHARGRSNTNGRPALTPTVPRPMQLGAPSRRMARPAGPSDGFPGPSRVYGPHEGAAWVTLASRLLNGREVVARLFFAVGVSPEVTSALESLCSKLKKVLRPTPSGSSSPSRRIIRCAFWAKSRPIGRRGGGARGSCGGERVWPVDPVASGPGRVSRRAPPPRSGIGAGRGAPKLVKLASQLEGQLLREGFSPRAGVRAPPHARAREAPSPVARMRALLTGQDETIGALHVASFVLMESRPTNKGARYIPLETFPLEIPCTPS
jgi:2'-5' RNA ligase